VSRESNIYELTKIKKLHMENAISRQKFLQYTAAAGAAMLLSSLEGLALETPDKKLRIGLIGCGSVSNRYIPHLQTSSLIEIVSLCDIKYDRAVAQNKQYNVNAATYPHIDKMLAGVPFDLMVTTTDMQVHGALNKKALMAESIGAKSRWPTPMQKAKRCLISLNQKAPGYGELLQ
jgi:hypothetical protein